MRFFVGIFQPCDARHFDAAFISVNRLRTRVSDFKVGDWIMDSGAFTEVTKHGGYRRPVKEYAKQILRWGKCGNLLAAVAEDFMCEAFVLKKTGKTVIEHQRMTIERYDALLGCDTGGVYIMPALQGYTPEEYVEHLKMYGDRLATGAWVGVGSVCKRNADVRQIEDVLFAIREARPDLKLHGFGLKATALSSAVINEMLYTADSMAWSFHARLHRRNGNDWREAKQWSERIQARALQRPLFTEGIKA